MKFLGVDYGDKRVGLATSDDEGKLAFPYLVIKNSENLAEEVLAIVEKEKVSEIVVGESLDFTGQPNAVMKNIEEFVSKLKEKLKEKEIPIHYEPEFMTSVQAERFTGKNEMHDASAAALILQSFLDRRV